jgi:bifunctional oligoribonuclease and PAP phosphatase NrnA
MPESDSDLSFLTPAKMGRVAIICHRHADPDTYLSAFALVHLVRTISPSSKVEIIIPEGMSSLTQKLAQTFPFEAATGEGDYDLMMAVDIGHTELLKDWNERMRASIGLKVLIDHHPLQKDSPYDVMIVDTNASSAAEVVCDIYTRLGVPQSPESAQALLMAILFDSQHLMIAREKTLRAVVRLLERGADLERARALLRSPPDYGEVVAKLKASKRMRIYRAAGWTIVASTVGSFQANVARAFISLGADASVVVGDFDEEVRGSLRANQRFYEGTKIHLGTDVAEVVSRGHGYGGGHPTAASFTCDLSEEEALAASLKILGELLREKPAELK